MNLIRNLKFGLRRGSPISITLCIQSDLNFKLKFAERFFTSQLFCGCTDQPYANKKFDFNQFL